MATRRALHSNHKQHRLHCQGLSTDKMLMDQYVCLPDWWRMEGFSLWYHSHMKHWGSVKGRWRERHGGLVPESKPPTALAPLLPGRPVPRQGAHTYLPAKRWIVHWCHSSMEPLMDKSSNHVGQPLERRLKPRSALSQLPTWREPPLRKPLSLCLRCLLLQLCVLAQT